MLGVCIAILLFLALVLALLMRGHTIALFEPGGIVGLNQRSLIIDTFLLMLIPIVAIYALAFFFAYWYRAGNTKAMYTPNAEHGALSELVWWAIPFEIILVLGALTWTSTHELDPVRPLSGEKHMIVEVVALPWKWLFIYPEHDIASVGELRLPAGVPVRFEITGDSPMNSFWIPQLGGQIYAMTGMATHLNLIAERPGEYEGLSANYSGEGFDKMKFKAIAMPIEQFEHWVTSMRQASLPSLTWPEYESLALPGTQEYPSFYSDVDGDIFAGVMAKFNGPDRTMNH